MLFAAIGLVEQWFGVEQKYEWSNIDVWTAGRVEQQQDGQQYVWRSPSKQTPKEEQINIFNIQMIIYADAVFSRTVYVLNKGQYKQKSCKQYCKYIMWMCLPNINNIRNVVNNTVNTYSKSSYPNGKFLKMPQTK